MPYSNKFSWPLLRNLKRETHGKLYHVYAITMRGLFRSYHVFWRKREKLGGTSILKIYDKVYVATGIYRSADSAKSLSILSLEWGNTILVQRWAARLK